MIKMIGLIMIVGSCSAMGFSMNRRLTARAKALAGFIAAFQIIKAEIVFRALPLPEIMGIIEAEGAHAAADFFGRMAEKMAEGRRLAGAEARALLKGYGLRDADARHITAALGALGRYDGQTQADAINLAIRGLESELGGARAEAEQKGKLYRAMGVTVGIMVALIVI